MAPSEKRLSPILPEAPRQNAPKTHCGACGAPTSDKCEGMCYPCWKKAATRLQSISRGIEESGIDDRHQALRTWEQLTGPPEYERRVARLRDWCVGLDGIVALLGGRGCGKSQLGCVAVRSVIESDRTAKRRKAYELTDSLKARFKDGGASQTEWVAEWSRPQLLVIDEFGEQRGTDTEGLAFTALLDARYEKRKGTILIANLTVRGFEAAVGSSIADRIHEGGMVLDFTGVESFRRAI